MSISQKKELCNIYQTFKQLNSCYLTNNDEIRRKINMFSRFCFFTMILKRIFHIYLQINDTKIVNT